MNTKLTQSALIVSIALTLITACGATAPEPTLTPTVANTATKTLEPTQTFTPTSTVIPTRTPKPTSTPDMAATQKYDSLQLWVEKLASDKVIPSVEGKYHSLDDYSDSLAKSGYFNWVTYDDFTPTNFVFQARARIENETTENAFKSGCGLMFEDAFSNHALFFALDGNANYRTDGADRGSKYIDNTLFQNPDGVTLTVILSNKALSFYVNDRKAITQTVYGEDFNVGLSILSGTSEGFGTRCDFSEVALWEME